VEEGVSGGGKGLDGEEQLLGVLSVGLAVKPDEDYIESLAVEDSDIIFAATVAYYNVDLAEHTSTKRSTAAHEMLG
jgi:hypothetical protein